MVSEVGQDYANQLKHRRAQPGDKWHLDEVFLTINGQRHYLWRAVDQDDNVLDILVQSRRNKQAAKKFFRKLLKGLQYVPRVIITDKLKSYNEAHGTAIAIRQVKYLNNIVEQDHRAIKRVTRPMLGCKAFATAQATLTGIELRHMIKKKQMRVEVADEGRSAAELFYALAA